MKTISIYDETFAHMSRVGRLGIKFGSFLKMNMKDLNDLHMACMYHDIGKTLIDKSVLYKRDPLTLEEWTLIREHPIHSYHLAKCYGISERCRKVIKCHHESFDGSGYPEGLTGTRIPYLARVLRIVDSFDAMTSERIYRSRMTVDEALGELELYQRNYDAEILKCFFNMIQHEIAINYSVV